jgi:alginate O-acetyltransferase complex protein AlgI
VIFNTFEYYFLFLFPAAFAFKFVPRIVRPWVLVLSASAFFIHFSLNGFGGAAGAYCLLIFLWESAFSRLYRPAARICFVGVLQSVVFLATFKYWNYLTGLAFSCSRTNPLHWRGAFLPLGISFFTFEFIHYAVDRYRGRTEAGTVGEYLAFIMFFPTMVAGPIKRYQDFLPKFRVANAGAEDLRIGFTRILVGLVKKFAVADLMTAFTVHLNAGDIVKASRGTLALWLFAYGVKIYFDFAGYSDIAIGSARLFGIKVPENFNWPYFRTNITEFWRNWHISLSNWLLDYVFITLGGSRVPTFRIYSNLIVTMFVSGVWHGAGTNFVVWGLWHGMMLAVHRAWRTVRGAAEASAVGEIAAGVLTFVSVNLGWAFFCMDLPTARLFLSRLIVA